MRGLAVGELPQLVQGMDTVVGEVPHRPVDVCSCVPLLPCLSLRFDRYGWSESGPRIVLMLR